MDLIKLIYVSTVSKEFELTSFEDIMNSAQENNGEHEVTGILYFNQHYFIQYLEGSEENVESTYRRIQKDKRHCNVTLLDRSSIENRQFSGWSMAYLLQSEILKTLNFYFMDSPEFNPYRLDAQSANELITELRSHLPLAYLHSDALSKTYR